MNNTNNKYDVVDKSYYQRFVDGDGFYSFYWTGVFLFMALFLCGMISSTLKSFFIVFLVYFTCALPIIIFKLLDIFMDREPKYTYLDRFEINTKAYKKIKKWVVKYPELKPIVSKYTTNNIITKYGLLKIKMEKNGYKQKAKKTVNDLKHNEAAEDLKALV